jgi:gp16 family phage-associated protein
VTQESPSFPTDRSPGPLTYRGLGLVLDPEKIAAVKARLAAEGISAWARENGFREKSVHDVLSGKRPCIRGQSHKIAVKLGLMNEATP